jgi:hypothetical protein
MEYNKIQWNLYKRMLVADVPPHIETGMARSAAKQLLKSTGALLIRWVSDFDCQAPTQCWYVIKDGKVSLDELSRNSRHDVRRGLKRCSVRQVDKVFIANNAYPVYLNAFQRYKTLLKPVSETRFREGALKSSKECWGVFDQSSQKLAGYCTNRFMNNCCEFVAGYWDPDYLGNYSSTAILYEMTRYYLNELGAIYVSDGQRSILHDTNIQDFLIQKLCFRKAYCRLNIVYSPVMQAAINLLYPLRNIISSFNENISALLKQEEIRRSFDS